MLWYEPEQYAGVIKIMSDRKSYPSTYDAWLGPAAREERRLQGDGWRVIRVAIEPASFRAWCAGRGFRRDSEARKAYAREEATQVLRKER